ncbi:uncharacterized protein C2orf72 homolog isoform X1 [Narcine bancroftii]|uniref:uncharacterized protein C2orf72 homolog isoform X1 n=1 Tax=Narcine bancroftii TaxID=1343680 RepID=UPI003831C3C4
MDLDAEWTEREFQQVVNAIGGRESIFLIGEVSDSRDLMFQFVNNLFQRPEKVCSGIPGTGSTTMEPPCNETVNLLDCSAKVAQIVNGSKEQRRINARLIIFLFHQDFICDKQNDVMIRELLKDVRQRSSSWEDLPGLIGVVHADAVSGELDIAVRLVEYYLRTVFHQHPGECVQAFPFISNQPGSMIELKKTICVVLRAASRTTEDTSTSNRNPDKLSRWITVIQLLPLKNPWRPDYMDLKKRRQSCFPGFFCLLGNTRRRKEDRDINNIWNGMEAKEILKDTEKEVASQKVRLSQSTDALCKTDQQIDSNGNNELNMETEV